MPQFNYQTGQMEETEEERRAREAASDPNTNIGPVEPTPIKETRTIDPATGEVELTIKGNERDLSAANTNTPTYTGARAPAPVAPVAPGSTFDRMIQVESGGRQTDAQGRVLTSNKGAMGIAQVMPTTAMDPGYGVKNIFDLAQERGIPFQTRDRATAEQLLGNRALNQEFGANYYAAMNKKFDGGPGAVAAYNAGPGRVSQNMAQNQGQLNVAQLPQETQGYLQKVGMPAPAQRPPQPVSPEQLAQQPMPANQGINPQRPGLQIPGLTALSQMGQPAAPAPNPTEQAISRYQAIQDKPDELMKFAFDANTPDYLKQRAKDQLVQSYDSQKKESQAQAAIPTMNQNDIARAMTKKSEGNSVGDWVQYLLFKHVGLTDLANQKGEQLGIGHKWAQSSITDDAGNDIGVEIQTTASGRVLSGNRLDGTPLTAKELNTAGAAMGSKLNLVGGTFVNDKTGEVGRVVSDEKTGRTYVQTDKGRRPMEGFRPQSSTGTASDQRNKLIQDMNIKLQGKTLEQQMTIQQDYNKLLVGQGLAPLQPNDTPLVAPQIAGGPTVAGAPATAPQPGAPRPAAGAVAPTPLPPPGAPAAGPRPTASQIAATAEQQKQEAQEVGVDLGKVRTNFGKSKDAATRLINQAEDLITDKGFSVSVGASIQPGFQYIPGSDRATWKAKHEEVVGQTFLTAIESLKGMGALSDKEGSAATAAISRLKNTDQNEESFKAAVRELQFIVKRGVDRNAEKLGQAKPFGTSEPQVGTTDSSGGTTSSGNKYKKVQ